MSRTATAAKVTRSYGVTPKSRLLIKRVSPKAAHIPMAAPTSANLAPCRKTVSTLCPERQTNANFALALRHSVRNYAVDADVFTCSSSARPVTFGVPMTHTPYD
jgi:hypothetical protein